jgi:peptide-methionine (S)-S-oxide reductase
MLARTICATLTAAFLAVFVLACGWHEARAGATKTAIFAGGCFWCVEDAFDEVDGVTETISGYAGGTMPNPTYGQHQGYVEAVKVTYDPAKVTYAKLLDQFWHNIDPFDPNGQFCDQGPAYHTVIFVNDDAEKQLAETTEAEIAKRFHKQVATEIRPVTTFTAAEDYHQNYHEENPVSYKYYKWGCGRAQRLAQIWGKPG